MFFVVEPTIFQWCDAFDAIHCTYLFVDGIIDFFGHDFIVKMPYVKSNGVWLLQ